ncbi:putative quinol monooxygenase [Anaerostipes butyraticus]|uniref:Monooxygenase n=1 Tax=Anaerostipes butyraticus TaxID=645466 RepID=A0A916VEM0_9FIRM|nr:antibiotic biosynthesis monooxygenase [Anaerostipes butyraticus]GFO86002.1 monooxygenase [Anaerostipes butyraticus]
MSITMNLYYTGKDGNARKFAEEMEQSGTAALIRAEDGNEKYDYFFPMSDPETVLLIDSWKDQESIDVHHASPMMNTIAELREKYDLHMRAERYISDDESISDADKKFIKK